MLPKMYPNANYLHIHRSFPGHGLVEYSAGLDYLKHPGLAFNIPLKRLSLLPAASCVPQEENLGNREVLIK